MINARSRAITAMIAVVLVAAVIVVWTRYRSGTAAEYESSQPEMTVEKRIELMFDAAQNGDIAAFKLCFTNPLLGQLNDAADKLTPATLRKSEANLNGFSAGKKTVTGDAATIIVEKIYPDHNARYRFLLKRIKGDWKIAEIRALDKHAPKIKYGTPVVPGLEMKQPAANKQ